MCWGWKILVELNVNASILGTGTLRYVLIKDDRRNSGGTLQQKFNVNDILQIAIRAMPEYTRFV